MKQFVEANAPAPKPAPREYTMDDVSRALNAMLAFGGSATAAHRALKESFELEIPVSTLRSWKESVHAEAYAGLQNEHGAALEQAMVREIRDIARAAGHAERLAVEKVIEEMSKENSRLDPATVALNMAKIKDTNVNKLLALTGRPQEITEHRSPADLLRALESKGILKTLPAAE